MSDYRKRLEAAVKSIQQEHLRMLTNGDGGGMAAREMAEYFDMAIGYTAVCEALWKCERWMSSYSPALSSDALQSARAALRVARGEEKPTDRASEENLEVARKWWLIYFEDHEMRPEVFESESVAQARFTELSQNWNCHLFHSVARGEKHCKWCAEGAPEWSFDAKIWIHRRDRLDRRCENPPNNYGYTTQVPEMTVSDEKRAESRGEKTENNCHCDFSDAWRCARARRLGEVACTCACHRGASLSGQEVPREQV